MKGPTYRCLSSLPALSPGLCLPSPPSASGGRNALFVTTDRLERETGLEPATACLEGRRLGVVPMSSDALSKSNGFERPPTQRTTACSMAHRAAAARVDTPILL